MVVAAWDVLPPMVTLIGTATPVVLPAGTTTLICISPVMEPKTGPAYFTLADAPPIVTVGSGLISGRVAGGVGAVTTHPVLVVSGATGAGR